MSNVTPVILSGGSGTRLWPQSRASRPKQFVELLGESSLFDVTLARVARLCGSPGVVVANEEHRFLVAERLRVAGREDFAIVLEPFARNTAPAIALAAMSALEADPDACLFVAPADHLMEAGEALADALAAGARLAADGRIVTFGIRPTRPDTGYGYVRASDEDPTRVAEFVEKPDRETAERFVAAGTYAWNSGMFVVGAATYLDELARHAPEMHAACLAAWSGRAADGPFTRIAREPFLACPSDSVDFAVMEKTDRAAIVTLDCAWSDLGSWHSVWETSERDGDGNATVGEVELLDAHRNYVRSSGKLVTVVGCDDLAVIESGDAILVARRDATSEIKGLVERMKRDGRPEADVHARVYRPWGNYEGVDRGERYQVKRIVVQPGQVLSLQKHYHRAEHWIVVRGVALVTCEGEQKLVNENESTYIPLGAVHRMQNPGNIPLELIEVQSGSYLGEDDIVRLEDVYGRSREDRAGGDAAPAPRALKGVS